MTPLCRLGNPGPWVAPALAAVLVGCAGDTGPVELTFAVDSTLVGEPFQDESRRFLIRPPAGWEAVATEATRTTEDAAARLLAVYRRGSHGGRFSVSRYDDPVNAEDRERLIRNHVRTLREDFAGEEVLSTTFAHHGYRVTQILAMNAERVTLRLFAERPETGLLRLDYEIPRSSYADELRSLESSIGSLDFTEPRR